ncbi:ribosome small subunit-dependent GTPase A [Filibacter tadaridae]|uniref:Small ribosomal subunit biogenesis GTPase RsgA n=1 Tax=Filibacter tadaridae TaxID=2483811 RepID=A0A3P5X633_9BACL|nr:ribosome small subunit-dependent GTPase A [Filibacter tadaridae]VDC25836.1 Putative ribosome biogenesis GTPase RsgA [Filibacter tadaridae]
MTILNDYGWNKIHEENWKELNVGPKLQKCVPGRVTLEHKKMFRIVTEEGEWLSVCSGAFQYEATERKDFPAVGDWVAVEKMPGEERGIIHALLPRTSLFSRKSAGTAITEQIIAVNVDIVFLVMSMNKDFNARRLERYLVAAYDSGANPVVVLTKKDVCEEPLLYIEEAQNIALGAEVFAISNVTGEGIEALTVLLKDGKTAALLGSSGVGKSSLTNAICGGEMMTIQDIRGDDDKGRHTTTHRELVKIPTGGVLIDTPGMREFQLWENSESLDSGFKDIEALAGTCKFSDCQHGHEPGCAVQEALTTGTLPAERYASYLKLQKELAFLERKMDSAAKSAERNKWKKVTKSMRKHPSKKK